MEINFDIDVEAERAKMLATANERNRRWLTEMSKPKVLARMIGIQNGGTGDGPEVLDFGISKVLLSPGAVALCVDADHSIPAADVRKLMDLTVVYGGETLSFAECYVEKDTVTEGGSYYDDPASTYPVAWVEFRYKVSV